MEPKEIFSKRLKMARLKEGLSMEELSAKTGGAVSKQTISKYEAGKTFAGSAIMNKLALVLNVTIEYLCRPFAFDINQISISFRKKANVGAKEQQVLKSLIQEKVEQYLEIEKILSKETLPNTLLETHQIKTDDDMINLARQIRLVWKMGNSPIENVKETLFLHGLKVFDIEGPEGFDGVSGVAGPAAWIIVLNKNVKTIERKRMTALHEFGHLLADTKFDPTLTQKEKENLCNAFASEMLLPAEILFSTFRTKTKIALQELVNLQSLYGISIDAIIYSLKRNGIISDKRHRDYCIRKNVDHKLKAFLNESRYKEKTANNADEEVTFLTMVYSALAQELITPARAAEFLNVTTEEIINKSITI